MYIENFKSRLTFGGLRPNHFRVTLNSPSVSTLEDLKEPSFLIKAASLPASSVTDIPVMYRGREIHVVGERTFAPWTITVINEVGSRIRAFFERWHNGMQFYSDTAGDTKPLEYKIDFHVEQIDRDYFMQNSMSQPQLGESGDNIDYHYKFYGAYPIEVGEIGLSYDINNAIEEFPVTFVYDYFVPNKGQASGF